jgi:hypothetical protein
VTNFSPQMQAHLDAIIKGISPPATPESTANGSEAKWPDVKKGGGPAVTCTNARHAIELLGVECRYDRFHDRLLVGGHAIQQFTGELSDHACQMLRVIIREKFGFDPGADHTNNAAIQLCLQHGFDPICHYLDCLEWDEEPRLDTWLTAYLGAEDTPFVRAVGRLTLVAAVRRAYNPGCKFDQITVLESPEGTGKSTAIRILAGDENFSDQTIIGLDDRQQQEAIRGVWLYEIADLAGMSKADVDRTKAFASRQSDRARPAYGRHRVELPRRCVFFGTTNNETYLKSQTGNRRFWPIKTGTIDLKALTRDRDQLWAEAVQVEASGATLSLPQDLWPTAAAEQDRRRDHDPWDDVLAKVEGHPCDSPDGQELRIFTTELFDSLGLSVDKRNDANFKRLSFSMERLGWRKPRASIRIGGEQGRGYTRPSLGRGE